MFFENNYFGDQMINPWFEQFPKYKSTKADSRHYSIRVQLWKPLFERIFLFFYVCMRFSSEIANIKKQTFIEIICFRMTKTNISIVFDKKSTPKQNIEKAPSKAQRSSQFRKLTRVRMKMGTEYLWFLPETSCRIEEFKSALIDSSEKVAITRKKCSGRKHSRRKQNTSSKMRTLNWSYESLWNWNWFTSDDPDFH